MSAPSSETQAIQHTSRTVRRLLATGFGGLLAIMVVAGLMALRTLADLHAAEEAARRDYLVRNQALSTVNVSIHMYGDQVEQLFLDTTNSPLDSSIADHLSSLFADAHSALQQYPESASPTERQLLVEMDRHLSEQEQMMRTLLSWGPLEKRRLGPGLYTRQIVPSRLQLLEASQQMASINRARLTAADSQLFAHFASLRRQLGWMIVLALASGLMLSLLCAIYILRLESQGRARYEQIARSQRDLEQLSARLVDAQEEERRALSRELHDEVGQSLSSLLVEVARLKNQLPSTDAAIQGQLGHIATVAENTVQTVRNMALLLRPSMLDDLGLVPALEWQGREVSRRGQMEVAVSAENIPDNLPDDLKICIYRVVQESLNNASRHAKARNATVSLTQDNRSIHVVVSDHGQGFEAEHVRGLGLVGIEERVRRLGGTFSIKSQPGHGTTILIDLPLASEEPLTQNEETSSTAR